ncbi:Glycosyl hydrolases family 25 [Amycolatopsis xylanica]|uniref:Glycosyl hydrolases family 25 n=1 Tax=Amycolatopsis xylanica TaxID=589385 RepID=A0A1H2T4A7_9PSEU|nr:glycoside hydrolase family 25 protein [Amycolatopsis xylanica]SDW38627.1 Glycosyl hydrolases family 25 [Amycolatopsis xylanica]
MTDYGIDVSHWNNVYDWYAVSDDGIGFASLKLTEGTGWVDNTSADRVPAAIDAGVVPGGYHFARPGDVSAQVDHFVGQLDAAGLLTPGCLAPMLDMEDASLRPYADDYVGEFIELMRDRTEVSRILVYANLDWYTRVLRPDYWADDEVRLWIARYNGDPGNPGWEHPLLAVHQHTQTGKVSGVAGNVDRNATVDDFAIDDLLVEEYEYAD